MLKAVWFYAIAKPFSADEFKATVKVFRALTIEWSQLDMLIPELYSINSIGGDNAVTKHVGAFLSKEEDGGGLKYKSGSYLYSELASALMWMKAHQAEHLVLKAMLDHQLEMTQKMQERLHAFSSGRGDTPKVLDVDLKSLEVNIDLSSLAWNDDAYEGFFENLAFQEKSLPYALAIRDDDTALLLGQRIEYLGMEDICGRIKTVFQDEFGYDASVKIADCVILSGSGREQMRGILAYSKECSQLHGTEDPAHSDLNKGNTFPSLARHPEAGKFQAG